MNAQRISHGRSAKIRAAVALLSVVGFGTVATLAAFSDQGSETATFSTGTLDMKFDGTTLDSPTALTTLNMVDVKPGTVKVAPLTVQNAGDLAFGYAMTTAATDALAPALQLSVVKVTSVEGCTAAANFAPTATANVLVPAATALDDVAVTSSRALAVGASEVLCFKVELPQATDNTFQGKSASATFTFRADQN